MFVICLSLHKRDEYFCHCGVCNCCFTVGKTPGLYAIVVKGKLQRGHDYDGDDQTDY